MNLDIRHEVRVFSMAGGAVLVVIAALLITQGVRQSWPFSATGDQQGRDSDPKKDPNLNAAHTGHEPSRANNTEAPAVQAKRVTDRTMEMPAEAGSRSWPPSEVIGNGSEDSLRAHPEGYAPIMIDPKRAEALELRTAPVEEREFTKTVRTVGVVGLDETKVAHVHSKVRGWIDRISVDYVGKKVRRGEPLCFIFSQEVYSAKIEFLSLLEQKSSASPASDSIIQMARRRLLLWDVPESEIARLENTREARRTFPLLAPRAGTVVAKEAFDGMYVDPSLELYTLADLSTLWVLADIYEVDVAFVHRGDRAQLEIEGREAPVDAEVEFLSPTIDEATRTRKVRFVLQNKDGRLLPGSFVSVRMSLVLVRGLGVPESAVIRTGTRSIVFVVHGDRSGHIEPRELTLGPLVGDHYRVTSGVTSGDQVAIGAQFLLDSESRLRATSGPGGGHAH